MMRALIAVALLGAHAGYAQNLVPNPDFDTGIESWQMPPGNIGEITHVADDGSPAPGSLRLERGDEGGRGSSTSAISACIPVEQGTSFDLIGNIKLVAGAAASVLLLGYSDDGCSTAVGTVGPALSTQIVDSTWRSFEATEFTLPDNVGSVVVLLNCGVAFPATASAALYDRIGFGPSGSVPVTLQSFRID